jgi:hypothetical protein
MATQRGLSYAPHPLAALVFCTLTGGEMADWLRFQRQMRVVRLGSKILVVAGLLIAREIIGQWAAGALSDED